MAITSWAIVASQEVVAVKIGVRINIRGADHAVVADVVRALVEASRKRGQVHLLIGIRQRQRRDDNHHPLFVDADTVIKISARSRSAALGFNREGLIILGSHNPALWLQCLQIDPNRRR